MQKLNANSKIDSVLDYLDPDRKKYANAEESSVHKAISALLEHNLTTIHCDTISEEYTIDNEKLHLTVFIYGSELKIRIVNTNKDVDYMFRRKFMKTVINDVIDKKLESNVVSLADYNPRINKDKLH